MANKNLFASIFGKLFPKTDTVNHELAPAYRFSPRQALAQYAATGCLNATFYASAEQQLEEVLKLAGEVDSEFVAKTAVYCRETGSMKDMPALLCAALSTRSPELLGRVFPRVIDNGKMLRNFVQILRSGVVGRKSLGTRPKRLVQKWLATRSDSELFRASVGASPSMGDVIRMVHPRPESAERSALYEYLCGGDVRAEALPELVRRFEKFKRQPQGEHPEVPFEMLTALPLGTAQWKEIARQASWQMTRMNLNTFARHGVFEDRQLVELIAARLRDRVAIEKARAFPYQLLMAYRSVGSGVPLAIREALQDAMEIATANVPAFQGRVVVCPDVSGSMRSPVTGLRKGATTAVRCVDVAALVAACVVRKNSGARVIPFEQQVAEIEINPRDSIMTNAEKLGSIGGGGTNCSAPLELLNRKKEGAELVIFVSDNESWVDSRRGRGTAMMHGWSKFLRANPTARLVCIDIQPSQTTQAQERSDILNVGGFSDRVFEVVAEFAAGRLNADRWVGVIESVAI